MQECKGEAAEEKAVEQITAMRRKREGELLPNQWVLTIKNGVRPSEMRIDNLGDKHSVE